jgi:Ca-activated chloride channel family protein
MMRLANPSVLLLLPLLLGWLLISYRRQRPSVVAYSSLAVFGDISPSFMTRVHRVLPMLRVLSLGLCVIALARPQQGLQSTKVYSEGIAILMVVDTSGSMAALDLQIDGQATDRLTVVKHTFRQFVQGGKQHGGRPGDVIGMVAFARYADSISPLTLDHDTLLSLLDQVEIVTLREEDGTAVGEAIALGVARLRDSTAKSRVMILLTDGANNAGETEPMQAAEIAKALGIKIYTIGAGKQGVAPVPVRARDGRMVLRRMQVYIDERTLRDIAELTGGQYFRATDSATLESIYSEIDQLEKTTNVVEQFQQYAERFYLFLLPAVVLLLLEIVLTNTRFRTVP